MKKLEQERFRRELMSIASRLKGHVSHLQHAAFRQTGGEASGNLSNAPLHLADLGSDTFEQEVSLSLLENEDLQLQEVSKAVTRINNGSFGQCEECHQAISHERLQALPYARLCIECARAEQESIG